MWSRTSATPLVLRAIASAWSPWPPIIRASPISALVLPVSRLSGRNPSNRGRDPALPRLVGFRRIDPFDILTLVARREGAECLERLLVLLERSHEIGRDL